MDKLASLLTAPTSDSNIAWGWIKLLFATESATPWTTAIYTLSTSLMLAAVAMLSWHTLAGIVQSAHSGKVLGERWHQIWAPARVVIGIGLLTPVVVSGLSPGHLLLREVALVSTNLADRVWSGFVSTVARDGHPLAPVSAGGRDLVIQILVSEVCHLVYAQAPVARLSENKATLPDADGTRTVNKVGWNWGTACGSLTLSMPDRAAGFADARRSAVAEAIAAVRGGIADRYATYFSASTGASITNEFQVETLRNASILPRAVMDFVTNAGETYERRIMTAAAKEAAARDTDIRARLTDSSISQGWGAAGMYWRSLSETSGLTTAYATEKPTSIAPRPDAWGPDREAVKAALAALQAQLRTEGAVTANTLAFAGDAQADILTRTLAPLTRPLAEWATSSTASNDPIGRMINFGHILLSGGEAAIAAGAIASAAGSNVFASAVGADGAINWLLAWAGILILMTLVVGVVYAYVLPVIPFIFVVFLAIGWVATIIEGMIAVPIWAMMWVRMDGQDLVDQVQQPGLAILFNLILRPVVGIIALCASYYVVPIGLNYINTLWGTAFTGAQGGHVVGIVGIVAGIVILLFVQWKLVLWTFGLITELPDRVARWFGAPTTGWDEGQAGNSAVTGAVGMIQAGGGRLPGAPPMPSGAASDGVNVMAAKTRSVSAAPSSTISARRK